jgi:ribosomal protein S18 acetylase RimI-like enzyme
MNPLSTPTKIVYRPLGPEDEPFLWEMLYQAIYIASGAPALPKEIVQQPALARYVQGWGKSGDMGFLAIDENTSKPAGAAWLRLLAGENCGYGYIDDATPELSIAILPEYRGGGIGTHLLDLLLAAALDHFTAVSLSVSPDNPAVHLYQHCGFQVVSAQSGSLIMRKA